MASKLTAHEWMGRPIQELDRDELLEVINELAEELGRLRNEMSKLARHVDWGAYLMDGHNKAT